MKLSHKIDRMKIYDTKSTTCCLLFVVEDGLKQI